MKFIAYIPFGYPSLKESKELINVYYDAGCRAFELSLPVYNAVGESPTIVDFMNKALLSCDDYDEYFLVIKDIRKKYPNIELNLLLFFETIYSIGIEKFCTLYHEVNVNAIICPQSKKYEKEKELMMEQGVKFFTSFHYDVSDNDLQLCKKPNGIIYMTAFNPEWQIAKDGFSKPKHLVDYLRSNGVINPIYAGVGIKTIDDVIEVKQAGADGFFVGGTLMALMEDKEKLASKVKEFIKAGL